MYVAAIKCSNHKTRIQNKQLAVYISDTSETLNQSQGHQTSNDTIERKQDYNLIYF